MFHKNLRFDSVSVLTIFFLAAGFLVAPLTTSCLAFVSQMTDEQAAQTLRALTKDGRLPPENAVLEIENRFSKTKTGALARLLRAYIHFEANDFNGTAQILSSNVFREKTAITDYALWLRGKSLQQAGNHAEAINVFAELVRDFPNSLRTADTLFLTAKSYEAQADQAQAAAFYRKVYFYGAGSNEAKEAELKLTALGQTLTPQTAEEIQVRADRFYDAKKYAEAQTAYSNLIISFPNAVTPAIHLKRLNTFANLRLMSEAQGVFNMIPLSANEKAEGFYSLARGYANARLWAQARLTVEEMRQKFPANSWTPKTIVAVGTAARDAKNILEESYFLRSAVTSYPNAVEVAGAQFELAWNEHENNNLPVASQMLTEHLARYADKDTTNRGKAGYWAARDSERAAKTAEACALYDAVLYRYGANWYGYLALQRLTTLRGQGKCQTTPQFPADSSVAKAVANLKTVTVAAETSTAKELERAEKSEQLSTIGLFDWAIEELQEAKKTAQNSPNINLALARHYRFRGDNVNALLTLAKSYPDYSQMFPEEMGREEWSIFYPLTNWNDIKLWARSRNLDSYTVAGLIRQESVFNARAKSGANAYGLMQLLIPTARSTAKKYGSSATVTGETLFQPALNIELGTAYMRDQFNKFGRIEFVAVAYNAGPGRVPQWQATLPYEMDEFVEEIPFRETKGYVQGVIRNSAQYRRLYDENGNFKSNVGTRPLRGEIDQKTREQFAQEFPEIVLDDNKTGE